MLRLVARLALPLVLLPASLGAQQHIDIADGQSREVFDSSTQNKLYKITNDGPDKSITIWRYHDGAWEAIAVLGKGESHTVTPDAGDKLGASDNTDGDHDGATVTWVIS